MLWKKKSVRSILISAGILVLILLFPTARENWGYFFGMELTILELPVLIGSDELTLLKKAGLTFVLVTLGFLLNRFFCEAERVDEYLSMYAMVCGFGIPLLLLKRINDKW